MSETKNTCCSKKVFTTSHSTLQENCDINVFAESNKFQLSGIVCTIGPACNTVEAIEQMIAAGMCIARHNFSHASHDDHAKMMDLVRKARANACPERPIAIALDTKGPEIRTGLNKDGANIVLTKDETIILTTDDSHKESSTKEKLYIDYKSLAASIKPGQIILVADGNVVLRAKAIKGKEVECDVISGASFGSKKNVCLPQVKTDLPALSEKDVSDIKFGLVQKVDIIFASFIRSADNVREIRKILNSDPHGKFVKIISKIENYEGVHDIEEIIKESDGVMVARGDLGMDLDLERVNVAQKMIIAMCNKMGKPVINATQMLESMIGSYRPTRAEVADVTNAILDGADAVMLSGESANGKYPIQAVKFMRKISQCAEKAVNSHKLHLEIMNAASPMTSLHATAAASVTAAYRCCADAIVIVSNSEKLMHAVSMFRPNCPVFVVTRIEELARTLHLYRALNPLLYKESSSGDNCKAIHSQVLFAYKYASDKGLIKNGSKVVVLNDSCQADNFTMTIKTFSSDVFQA